MRWREDVIQPMLAQHTLEHIGQQESWIAREPSNPVPFFNLAQLYRLEQRHDEALALLLEAVRLNPRYADAHAALTEIYAVRNDYAAAWRHARAAQDAGNPVPAGLLARHGVPEIG
jgi:tetratricopeptide (TPR) repeat protein